MIPIWLDSLLENLPPQVSIHYRQYKNWRWGDAELRLLPYLCNRQKVGIDVGGFWGMYAYFIRRFSRELIAVEPNPRARDLMRKNLGSSVNILPYALSNISGITSMRVPELPTGDGIALGTIEPSRTFDPTDASGYGHSGLKMHPVLSLTTIPVETHTLDSIAPADTGFIKIDVEDHEMAVLQGGQQLLRNSQPNLLIELAEIRRKDAVRSTTAFLVPFGYRGYFLLDGKLVDVSQYSASLHQDRVWNFVFTATGDDEKLKRRFC